MLYYNMLPSTGVLTSADNFLLYPTILSTRSVRQYNWALCVAVHGCGGGGGGVWTVSYLQLDKQAIVRMFDEVHWMWIVAQAEAQGDVRTLDK